MKIEWDFSEFEKFAENLQNTHNFDSALMAATKEVAKVLHSYLLVQTPVDTGNLRKMWSAGDNLLFTVDRVNGGFEVTFINTARANDKDGFMYGVAVNDGHKSYNQYGGSYGWVQGRFFVEASILQTANSTQFETLIMNELQKWWEGCFNG